MKVRTIPILVSAAILFTTFGLAWAATREPVSISGTVDLTTFEGTATVTVGGEELGGSVQVIPLQDPLPRDGGLYFPEVMHVFAFEDGSTLTTVGEEFSDPTDENPAIHTLHGNMEIVTGTGVFEEASGELRVNGQMDWLVYQATFEARGAISR